MTTPLLQLERLLNAQEVSCVLAPVSEKVPYERLLAFFGQDYKERERVLEITAQTQDMGPFPSLQVTGEYTRVQFQFAFSFTAKESALPEIASVLLFINRLIELPGFEMNELDNHLYYRHVLLTTSEQLDGPLCLAVMGMILMLLDLFTETIEKIATGEATFNGLLEQIISVMKQLE